MKDIFDLIGRMFVSAIFFYEAIDSMLYFDKTKIVMTKYGFVWQQDFILYATIFCLFLGATLILMGYRTGFGAFLLLLYWIPITLAVYSFWRAPTDASLRYQALHFVKNIAIMGGIIQVLVHKSGKYRIRRIFSTTRV